jgi:hypothetical protein
MKHFVLASIFAAAVPYLNAAEPTARTAVLAELFTSEGCSSCPPADALLMKLDQTQPVAGAQIIVLSEHVDYWNSLGWNDSFSSAQFTKRQEAFGRALARETYTPQLVIDGRTEIVGSDGKGILAAVAREAVRPKTAVRIASAKREGNEVVVSLTVSAALMKGDVWVAIADDRDQTAVKRGENAGKTLNHVAVVRSLGKIGTVAKGAGLDKTVRVPLNTQGADLRVVVFVEDSAGPVSGAAVERIGDVR